MREGHFDYGLVSWAVTRVDVGSRTRFLALDDSLPGNCPVDCAGFLVHPEVQVPVLHGHDDRVCGLVCWLREPSERDAR